MHILTGPVRLFCGLQFGSHLRGGPDREPGWHRSPVPPSLGLPWECAMRRLARLRSAHVDSRESRDGRIRARISTYQYLSFVCYCR